MNEINRRAFLALAAAGGAALASVSASAQPKKRAIVKSLKIGMIKGEGPDGKALSIEERLRMAKDAGFESLEPNTIFDAEELKALGAASEKVGLPVDAIVCSTHWKSPLSDPDPAVYNETVEGMRVSLQNAKDLGGDMVLLVPAVVNPQVMYKDAWTRSIAHIRTLIPEADRLDLTIGIENVWNKFLLSPLEAAAYIDEIDHPRVKLWLDVGNMVLFGYPQDWIRTLGLDRICRVDVKDFKSDTREFTPLLDGSVDWPEVMRAFDEIGYTGVFAAEVSGGDQAYLKEFVADRMDKIIAM